MSVRIDGNSQARRVTNVHNSDTGQVTGEPSRRDPVQSQRYNDQMIRDRQPQASDRIPDDTANLAATPQYQSAYARANRSDRALLDEISGSPNALNAFATYQNLRSGPQNPERLTDSIVRDMTLGVANPRSADHVSPEGIMSPAHVENAKRALFAMPQDQFKKFASSYRSAGTGGGAEPEAGSDATTERQLMLKAIGARSGALGSGNPAFAEQAMNEVVNFGRNINGVNAERLKTATTVLQTEQTKGYAQSVDGTCGAATLMTMKAESDPIYAMRLRNNAGDGSGLNAQGEARLMNSMGAEATEGLNNEQINQMHNQSGVDPNVTYQSFEFGKGEMSGYLDAMTNSLKQGNDVPFGVMLGNGSGHALHISAVDGKPGERTFLVHDTGSGGQTKAVPEKDLLDGTFLSKHFGYPPEYGQGAYVYNVQMPTQHRPIDPYNLGIVSQQQVDQGLVNAAMEKHGQYVVKDPKRQPEEQEYRPPVVRNDDLDDGISIDDNLNDDL